MDFQQNLLSLKTSDASKLKEWNISADEMQTLNTQFQDLDYMLGTLRDYYAKYSNPASLKHPHPRLQRSEGIIDDEEEPINTFLERSEGVDDSYFDSFDFTDDEPSFPSLERDLENTDLNDEDEPLFGASSKRTVSIYNPRDTSAPSRIAPPSYTTRTPPPVVYKKTQASPKTVEDNQVFKRLHDPKTIPPSFASPADHAEYLKKSNTRTTPKKPSPLGKK